VAWLGRGRVRRPGSAVEQRHLTENLACSDHAEYKLAAVYRRHAELDGAGEHREEPLAFVPFAEDGLPRSIARLPGVHGEAVDDAGRNTLEEGVARQDRGFSRKGSEEPLNLKAYSIGLARPRALALLDHPVEWELVIPCALPPRG
jgi:hypothetical protein